MTQDKKKTVQQLEHKKKQDTTKIIKTNILNNHINIILAIAWELLFLSCICVSFKNHDDDY